MNPFKKLLPVLSEGIPSLGIILYRTAIAFQPLELRNKGAHLTQKPVSHTTRCQPCTALKLVNTNLSVHTGEK